MVSRDQCVTASQAGADHTVTSLLSTPARAASMLVNGSELELYNEDPIPHCLTRQILPNNGQ